MRIGRACRQSLLAACRTHVAGAWSEQLTATWALTSEISATAGALPSLSNTCQAWQSSGAMPWWPAFNQQHRDLHTTTGRAGYVQSWEEVDEEHIDPFALVEDEIDVISERLRHSVTSGLPILATAAEYFLRKGVEGKRLRPTMLLLMSSALAPGVPDPSSLTVDLRPPHEHPTELRRQQQRIAEITELIHVASLLHDDVIDEASTRRGIQSLNASVGNKIAILAGDFMLARASVSLASLRNTEIVELLSRVLEHLVTGEIMQITADRGASADGSSSSSADMDFYIQKTYCKTASLMANSCKAVAILAGADAAVSELAWRYGRHLGLAFQVVDDVLDLTGSSTILGKPALNDMKSGLATAPVLLAARQRPELLPLIKRKFKEDGDVSTALAIVQQTDGIQQARELAAHHCQMAADTIRALPDAASEHAAISRQALLEITSKVLNRKK